METPTLNTPEHRHYLAIREKNLEVKAAETALNDAKSQVRERRSALDKRKQELDRLLTDGEDPQQRLPLLDDVNPAAIEQVPASPEAARDAEVREELAAPDFDDWRDREVSVLAIPDPIVGWLYKNDVETLGDYNAYFAKGQPLTMMRGIGEKSAAALEKAWADYVRAHPEVDGG